MFDKNILVGYTGFVGSNISKYFSKTNLFSSKNITEAFNNRSTEICIYCGVKSEKFYANQFPLDDFEHINNAFNNIVNIFPKKIVLISTVDVFGNQLNSDENTKLEESKLKSYGSNRLHLENLVSSNFSDYHIIRLPALFGENLKKNFIFDILNPIPRKITNQKFIELSILNSTLMRDAYYKINDEFYELNSIKFLAQPHIEVLKKFLIKFNSSSLKFTDSRSFFQFYNLDNLWNDINKVIDNKIKLINLVSEPINAGDLYKFIFGQEFSNLTTKFNSYNLTSVYSNLWGNSNGYLYSKSQILNDIKLFINKNIK